MQLTMDSTLAVELGDLAGMMSIMQDPWNQNVTPKALGFFIRDLIEDGTLPIVRQ